MYQKTIEWNMTCVAKFHYNRSLSRQGAEKIQSLDFESLYNPFITFIHEFYNLKKVKYIIHATTLSFVKSQYAFDAQSLSD